ncbi:hypothetical protein OW763_09545 [Clostridium aestuarii]|uniref:Type IV pilus assembly protein PilO n=1 Tax=Clostridium aestuarii TaxID=338193 RepID=A0ABT4D3G5_9CLOT|nr:hypothetical protein [Clostridium aestuarii]MCY6484583.1 hypothetical protein [Clostridium aestuarii]
MKVSNREKLMLMILLLVALFAGYYKFVYSVNVSKVNELKDKNEKNKNEIQKLNNNIVIQKNLEKDIKITNAKIYESTNELFPEINEEKIIIILDEMMKKTGVKCSSISFSKSSFEEISPKAQSDNKKSSKLKELVSQYKAVEEDKNIQENKEFNDKKEVKSDKDKSEQVSSEVEKMTLGLNFEANYDQVIKFIDETTKFNKRIIISSLSFTTTENEEEILSEITGNMILEFYAVPKFSNEADKEYLKWDFSRNYGKINPFKANSVGKVNSAKTIKKYDFSINVKPISSDLPTVMIGKDSDTTLKSYLFADNEGIENIEIHFKKKDGKYYYKYRNQKQSYPKEFGTDGTVFNLKEEEINISVFSVARNAKEDLSGANIKLYNDTDKTVNVDIIGDDKERKRVTIVKGKGSIRVNNK